MAQFNIGDRVRIKDEKDWPSPPGFVFANAEGIVVHSDFDELMGDFEPYLVFVQLDKVGNNAKQYKDVALWFRTEQLEKR